MTPAPHHRLRALGVLLAAGAAALALAGCGDKVSEPFKDAPRSGTNNNPARTITNPDGFSNVAGKCDGPNMLYVAYHGDSPYAAIAVAANDPRCVGGTP